jgi:hypothetical protein
MSLQAVCHYTTGQRRTLLLCQKYMQEVVSFRSIIIVRLFNRCQQLGGVPLVLGSAGVTLRKGL